MKYIYIILAIILVVFLIYKYRKEGIASPHCINYCNYWCFGNSSCNSKCLDACKCQTDCMNICKQSCDQQCAGKGPGCTCLNDCSSDCGMGRNSKCPMPARPL